MLILPVKVAEALGLFEKAKTHGFTKEILADLYFDMFDSDKDQNVNFFEFVSGFATINVSELDLTSSLMNSLELTFFSIFRNPVASKIKLHVRINTSLIIIMTD